MDPFKRQELRRTFKEISKTLSSESVRDKKTLYYVFDKIIYLFSAGQPQKHIKEYLASPAILASLLSNIPIGISMNDEEISLYRDILIKLKVPKTKYFYRFRVLGSLGHYPDISFSKRNFNYTTYNLKPVLLTKNNYQSENEFNNSSEITIITRNELKFAMAVICASKGLSHIYFNSFETLDVDGEIVDMIPENLKVSVLMEIMSFKLQFSAQSHYRGEQKDVSSIGYHFHNFDGYEMDFYKFLKAYSITNQLLMRTSVHLLKAIMLWDNRTFAEDAIGHVLFSLEGNFHLLYQKWGGQGKINLKFLEAKFTEQFTEGQDLFNHIKAAYKKRIQFVHPETDWGSDWNPFLEADDFYEYFKISRALLLYYLTDIKREFPY